MNRKNKIIVSVVGIVVMLLALLGLTYAYYLTRIQGNTNTNSISVTTADLKLVYDDGSDGVIGRELLEPSDEEFTKTFTVYNDGNVNIDYGVYLIDVINTFERKDDIKYTMECSTDGTEPCGKVETATTFPNGISELVTATIEPKKTHTYTFKFTYKDTGTDQSVDMGKVLKAKIQIFGKNNNGLIIPYETNTLAYNILNNGADITSTTTTGNFIGDSACGMDEATCVANVANGCPGTCYEPGSEVTTTETKNTKIIKTTVNIDNIANGTSWDEELKDYTNDGLFSTEDNYGTSYYYRGPVSNNYVTFSNKCWRIVRIEGDGSVKLTLESQSSCSENMESDFSIGEANWGYKTENGKAIGDYKNSTSGMKNLLNTWFNSNFKSNGNLTNAGLKIKDEEWCLGNTTNTYAYSSPYGELGTTAEQNYASGTAFYYETGRNLYGLRVTPNATLVCNGATDSSKIGVLTADEVVYAGEKAGMTNTNYYLFNSRYDWWTLSRARFYSADVAFYVSNQGKLNDGSVRNDYPAVRPSVTLVTNTQITKGEGTIDDPYIVG